jgi:hypothetical protein
LAGPLPQVAVQGQGGLAAKGDRSGPAALAEDDDHLVVEVEVAGEHDPGRLRDADAGVEEQLQDGRVLPVGEVAALAGFQQPAQLLIGQHRRGLVGDLRRVHAGHRAGLQLALGHRPLGERLEAPVAVQGRGRLPAVELVGDEGPYVVAGDRLGRLRVATLGQEVGEQPDRLGVARPRDRGPFYGF